LTSCNGGTHGFDNEFGSMHVRQAFRLHTFHKSKVVRMLKSEVTHGRNRPFVEV